MSKIRWLGCLSVCLGVTGAGVADADPRQPDLYVEDPYAPHDTSGSEARLGTMAGFLYGLPQPVTEVGLVGAMGQRFGRFTIEAEAAYFRLLAESEFMTPLGLTSGDVGVGRGERLGLLARFDVLRLGSRVVGQNTLFAIYVEGGAATEWEQFSAPVDPAGSFTPDDSHRIEGQAGFGIALDHRLQEPIGFPRRIAWFLGWRLAMSPHQVLEQTVCRGETTTCERTTMPEPSGTTPSAVDASMLFQSSLAFTF